MIYKKLLDEKAYLGEEIYMNIVELPMNKKGYIRSNLNRASLFSILTSENYSGRVNTVIGKFSISLSTEQIIYGLDKSFQNKTKNVKIDLEQGTGVFRVSSHPYEENKYAYIYKKVSISSRFCMETKINYLQNSNANSAVKLVLFNRLGFEVSKQDIRQILPEVMLEITPQGKIIVSGNLLENCITIKNLDIQAGIGLRIKYLNNQLQIQYSNDNLNWQHIIKIQKNIPNIIEAGLLICPKINPFYYDFFTSHMQLCCTADTMIIAPHFESYERFFSSSLQSMHMPMDMLNITDEKIINLFSELIEKNYYINLGLNEYYIPGRSSYKKKEFIHANFVYGVDKKRKLFKLLGFDNTLIYDEISFCNFFHAIQRKITATSKINLYKYDSKSYPHKFNLPNTIKMLEAYLNGWNIVAISSTKILMIDNEQECYYGINILDQIINQKNYLYNFIEDRRIMYQVCEHIEIIINMMEFLKHIYLLSEKIYQNVFDQFICLRKNGNIILNIILKNKIAKVTNIDVKVKELLIKYKNDECKAIEDLIIMLKNVEINSATDYTL